MVLLMVAESVDGADTGVAGNARLTGVTAAVLLIALAIEGVTVLDVQQMIVVHFFVGLVLIPVTTLKLASTGWRFAKYYRRDPAYRRKGPPHPVLRVLGPLIVLSTIALLSTGVALLVIGPNSSSRDTVTTLHQASFIVWVSTMTIHVLGHIRETYSMTTSDLNPGAADPIAGRSARRLAVAISIVVGLGLGIGSLTWNHAWKIRSDQRQHAHADPQAAPGGG